MAIADGEGYTYDFAFDIVINTSGATSSLSGNATPNNPVTDVTWTPEVSGSLSVINTTPGFALPNEDYRKWEQCSGGPNKLVGAAPCAVLWGFWPETSPVCSMNVGVHNGDYLPYPVGKENGCHLMAAISAKIAPSYAIPIGGTFENTWAAAVQQHAVAGATQAQALIDELNSGPEAWVVAKFNSTLDETWADPSTQNWTKTAMNSWCPGLYWSPVPVSITGCD